MPAFFTFRCRPTTETARAAVFVASFIVVLGVMANFVAPRFGYRAAGVIFVVFYVVMYFATLSFARRQGTFSALGITRRRCLVAVAAGVLIVGVGVLGTVTAFPGGTFVAPVGWRSIAVLVFACFGAGFVEAVVFFGYFQFRLDEAFGAPIAIVGTAFVWTAHHAAVLAVPGAGTFLAQPLGPWGFLINLFVGFLVVAIVVRLTRNIWAGVVQNVLTSILVNLYMLSVAPEDVLIADPRDLPIDALFAAAVVAGLVITRRKMAA